MQMTASILSSYRIKLIKNSTTLERITSPKVVVKNRLKAANLRPEKPFAHWRHFMASKCAKWLIFRCVNQSLSAHLAKLAKFAQKNLQRKRKRKFPRGYAARGKSRVTSAIRYGRLETVKGHKGWWRRLPIFATLQSSVAVGIADTTSGAMRPHLVAVAPRPLLRYYVPCPLTVHRTVLGCPKPCHYRSTLTSQHHAKTAQCCPAHKSLRDYSAQT